MSFIEKAINPAFYKQKISTWSHATAEYYKPLFRSGSGDNWFDFSANAAVPPRPLATRTCILKSASSFNPLSIFQKMYMLNLSFFSLGCHPQCKTFVAHHDCNICSHVHPKLFVQQGNPHPTRQTREEGCFGRVLQEPQHYSPPLNFMKLASISDERENKFL
ncbi:hypothetical protein ACHAWT_002318 [Skeletonema menzelii]